MGSVQKILFLFLLLAVSSLKGEEMEKAKLKIVQIGEPVLRKQARELTQEEILSPEIQNLIGMMKETMWDAPGVGLAAPQIGLPYQLIVIEDPEDYLKNLPPEVLLERKRFPVPFHVVINPKITSVGEETAEFFEGCLSCSKLIGSVKRALKVHVDCLNEKGEPVTIDAEGWYARILQHEIDHLFGKLCIDTADQRSLMTIENYQKFWAGKSPEEIKAAFALD